MTYTVDSPIVGKPTGTLAEALAWLDIKAGAETEYATELWRLAGNRFDPAVAFAQWAWETADGSSTRWQSNRNPAGLGIESDSDKDPAKLTGIEAARLHAWAIHFASSKGDGLVPLIPESAIQFARRWVDKFHDPNCPQPSTIADLGKHYVDKTGEPQAVWGWDPNYANGIVSKLNTIFPNRQEQLPVPKFETVIPGLSGGPLVTDYPISLMIIPESQKLNRPGIKAQLPRRGVQHGAANPTSFARGDAIWAYNGAKNDQGEPTQTSFHATADEFGVTILVPADEVTWQAADGAGQGNMNGFSCEMSENAVYRQDMSRLRRNIYVNADFMGRIAARLEIAEPEQHWDFNFNNPPAQRHNCPNILRTMAIDGVPCWTIYRNQWNVSKIQELANMNPQPAKPPAPKPAPINWKPGDVGIVQYHGEPVYTLLAEVTCSRATLPRVAASTKKGKNSYGPNIEPGAKCKVVGTLNSPWYFWDKGDGTYPRISRSAFYPALPRPRDAS